jgi:hypothetical protein
MWARFRSFVAAAEQRHAEEDLERHLSQGHRLRAHLVERKLQAMRRGRTGDRVVSYLELGIRAR